MRLRVQKAQDERGGASSGERGRGLLTQPAALLCLAALLLRLLVGLWPYSGEALHLGAALAPLPGNGHSVTLAEARACRVTDACGCHGNPAGECTPHLPHPPGTGMATPPKYGDYEAQRHWMEMTLGTPVRLWYTDGPNNDPAYWPLDYPPLSGYQVGSHAWRGLALQEGGGQAGSRTPGAPKPIPGERGAERCAVGTRRLTARGTPGSPRSSPALFPARTPRQPLAPRPCSPRSPPAELAPWQAGGGV